MQGTTDSTRLWWLMMLQTGPIFFKRDSLPMPIRSDPSMQVNLGMYYQTIVITWTWNMFPGYSFPSLCDKRVFCYLIDFSVSLAVKSIDFSAYNGVCPKSFSANSVTDIICHQKGSNLPPFVQETSMLSQCHWISVPFRKNSVISQNTSYP